MTVKILYIPMKTAANRAMQIVTMEDSFCAFLMPSFPLRLYSGASEHLSTLAYHTSTFVLSLQVNAAAWCSFLSNRLLLLLARHWMSKILYLVSSKIVFQGHYGSGSASQLGPLCCCHFCLASHQPAGRSPITEYDQLMHSVK